MNILLNITLVLILLTAHCNAEQIFKNDISNYTINDVLSTANVVCGQTIFEDTILNVDLLCSPDISPAIIIGNSNITFDLGGHAIKGYSTNIGILSQDKENIIIKNGTIDGFNDGIFLINNNVVTLEQLTVKNIDVDDPDHFVFGIHIDTSKNVLVKYSVFEFLSVPHKESVEIYDSNVVVDSIKVKGGGAGVSFSYNGTCDPVAHPSNGEVVNSKFSEIYVAGIYVACTNSVRIASNDISTAAGVGCGIQADSPFNGAVAGLSVDQNTIHNDVIGIEFRGVIDSTLSNNLIYQCSGWGIALRPSVGCFVSGLTDPCFYSTSNLIIENAALDNGVDLYHQENCLNNQWQHNACHTEIGTEIPECNQPIRNISASPSDFNFESGSGSAIINVTSDGIGTIPWTAKVLTGNDWITITSGDSGYDSGIIRCNFTSNSNTSERTAIIQLYATYATVTPNIIMITQSGELKGDINKDGKVDLTDAIISLQVLSGMLPDKINPAADVDGDGKIGMAEAIYVMQVVAGLRAP